MAMHKFAKPLPEEPSYKLHKAIYDLSSEGYHSIKGTYSSSQLKDILDDEETFIKKYIERSVEKEHIAAFDVGNYFHTGILEPHKLRTDCVVYDGKVRRGSEWDKFKGQHKNKVILTPSQRDQAIRLIESVQDSPVAMGYIKRGKPEVSLFTEIWVDGGEIYSPKYNKVLDLSGGWLDTSELPGKFVKLIIKVRADSLGDDFVLDLKSTTGNARSEASMRGKITYYKYELSASLYLDMFSLLKGFQMDQFIWTFASKDAFNCKSYRASRHNLLVGRAKWMKAILKMVECQRNDWQLHDSLGTLEPEQFQLEWIKEKETDLL